MCPDRLLRTHAWKNKFFVPPKSKSTRTHHDYRTKMSLCLAELINHTHSAVRWHRWEQGGSIMMGMEGRCRGGGGGEGSPELPERAKNMKVWKRLHRFICGCLEKHSGRWIVRWTQSHTSLHRYKDRWPIGESNESLVEVCSSNVW